MEEYNLYLVLSYSGSFPAWLIRLFTHKIYSHSSISLDRELSEIYSFGRKKINNPLVGGFVIEKIGEGIYQKFPKAYGTVLEIPVTEEQYNKVSETITGFLSEKEQYKYAFFGAVLAGMGKKYHRSHRYYCSEFVRTVLETSGMDVSMLPPACKPMDFYLLPGYRTIYTGRINSYCPPESSVGDRFIGL